MPKNAGSGKILKLWPKSPIPEIPEKKWRDRQDFLKSRGVPHNVVADITTLKRMNLFLFVYSFPKNVYFEPNWKWVLDNEHNPKELNKLLMWKEAVERQKT